MILSKKPILRSLALAILLLAPATSCGDDPTGLIEGLTVENNTDSYTFELDTEGAFSGTVRDQWTHTGTIATLEVETAATSGVGTISIQDADNGQVMSRSVLVPGTIDTQTGRSGTWIITTILAEVRGPLKYRVTKK